METKVLGLIPARGGSKGIPRKNIRLLNGKPLLNYTVETALEATCLDRVIVSTDDDEIAQVALNAGAEVPFLRPEEYATDTASSISVIQHALTWLKNNEGYCPDAVAFLAPTSPLRTTEQIDETVNLLWRSKTDSAITICQVLDHPYYVYQLNSKRKLIELIDDPQKPLRSKELPKYYTHSQSVAVSLTTYINQSNDSAPVINLKSMAGFEIDRKSALDIDTLIEFTLAQELLNERYENHN
ncbi:MAG: acylneuraminate cytidylyltransferase family protein [Desulfobacterales bacterium]|nr:acylneuraminate cytidylyltransferase family protein [Desulfobacterales bacterium]